MSAAGTSLHKRRVAVVSVMELRLAAVCAAVSPLCRLGMCWQACRTASALLQVQQSGGRAMQPTKPRQLGSRAVCSCPSCPGMPTWALMGQCSRAQVPMPAAESCPGYVLCLHC